MLYDRWLQTVKAYGNDRALTEVASGRTWSFRELAKAADANSRVPRDPMIFPSGNSPEFIIEVLQAWREGSVVCPLEPLTPSPTIPLPPPGITHLKLTSGTTGSAKCVAFTEGQLAADADTIVATMNLTPSAPNLGVISLAHSYGFSSLVTPMLLHGIPLILAANPMPATVLEAARISGNERLTLPAVPAMWRAWHEAQAIPENIWLAISAGASLPLHLEQAIHGTHGLKVHNFVGASECGGMIYDTSITPRTVPGFAGRAMQGVSLSRNAEGCLEVRGPGVGARYWPESHAALRAGVYRTRDLAELDAHGGVILRGRLDDLINIAGRKVAPEAIETVLRLHSSVRECLVLGVSGAGYRGETIVAIIESKAGASENDLRQFAQASLPEWQIPKHWHFVEALAPNGRGKLSRAEWRTRLSRD
ncbi:MAG TPA: fatty acid--CoA ligase family protein [Candidatus Limnocylindria bacterium]|nr:fatty acid--CoA ligase family protein [Candidatus Limnocylindria bacterium]